MADYEKLELFDKMIHDGLYDGVLSFRKDSANVYFRRFFRLYMDGSYENDLFGVFRGYVTSDDHTDEGELWQVMAEEDSWRNGFVPSENIQEVNPLTLIRRNFTVAYTVTDSVRKKYLDKKEKASLYSTLGYERYEGACPSNRIINLDGLDESGKYYKPDKYSAHRLEYLKSSVEVRKMISFNFHHWLSIEYLNDAVENKDGDLQWSLLDGTFLCGRLGPLRWNLLMDVLIEEFYDEFLREEDEAFIEKLTADYDKVLKGIKRQPLTFTDRTAEMEKIIRENRFKEENRNSKLRGYYDNWSMNK